MNDAQNATTQVAHKPEGYESRNILSRVSMFYQHQQKRCSFAGMSFARLSYGTCRWQQNHDRTV